MSDIAPNTRPPNWVCQPPDPTGVQRPMRYHATRVLVLIHSQPKIIWCTRTVNAAVNLVAAIVYDEHRFRDLRSDLKRHCHTWTFLARDNAGVSYLSVRVCRCKSNRRSPNEYLAQIFVKYVSCILISSGEIRAGLRFASGG